MRCFYCHHLSLGEISSKHYYCMECCLEFKVVDHHWYGYVIDEEGDLHLEVSSEMTVSPAGTIHQTID
ncbi:MAG: hypothetical protein ACQER2_08260 [Bacillota bacterium]